MGSPTDSPEEVKWWSTDNAAYLDTAARLDVKTVVASSSSSAAKRSSVVPQSSPVSRRRDMSGACKRSRRCNSMSATALRCSRSRIRASTRAARGRAVVFAAPSRTSAHEPLDRSARRFGR